MWCHSLPYANEVVVSSGKDNALHRIIQKRQDFRPVVRFPALHQVWSNVALLRQFILRRKAAKGINTFFLSHGETLVGSVRGDIIKRDSIRDDDMAPFFLVPERIFKAPARTFRTSHIATVPSKLQLISLSPIIPAPISTWQTPSRETVLVWRFILRVEQFLRFHTRTWPSS